jgi:hypothetical protein
MNAARAPLGGEPYGHQPLRICATALFDDVKRQDQLKHNLTWVLEDSVRSAPDRCQPWHSVL